MTTTATNPTTGERIVLTAEGWKPFSGDSVEQERTATNPKTGEKLRLDRAANQWVPVKPPVEEDRSLDPGDMHGGAPTDADVTAGRFLGSLYHQAKAGVADVAGGLGVMTERMAKQEGPVDPQHAMMIMTPMERAEYARIVSENPDKDPKQILDEYFKGSLQQKATQLKGLSELSVLKVPEEYQKPVGTPAYQFLEQSAGGVARFAPGMAVTAVSPGLGFATMYAQILNTEYTDMVKSGAKPDDAYIYATLSALAQAPLEQAGTLIQLGALKKLVSNGGAQFLVRLLEAAGAEGLEEGLQKFPSDIAKIYAANPDLTPEQKTGEVVKHLKDPVFWKEAGTEVAMGATGGAMLFGMGGALTLPAAADRYKSQLQKDLDAIKPVDILKPEPPPATGILPSQSATGLTLPQHTPEEGQAMQYEIARQRAAAGLPMVNEKGEKVVDRAAVAQAGMDQQIAEQSRQDEVALQQQDLLSRQTALQDAGLAQTSGAIPGAAVDQQRQQLEVDQRMGLELPPQPPPTVPTGMQRVYDIQGDLKSLTRGLDVAPQIAPPNPQKIEPQAPPSAVTPLPQADTTALPTGLPATAESQAAVATPATQSVDAKANEAATSPENNLPEPTDAQKAAGNYQKGKISWKGLEISIENPEGSTRTEKRPGDAADDWEPAWSSTMTKAHYGYFRGGKDGKDGDAVDAFMAPGDKQSEKVFVIDQINLETGKFDEAKVMVGYPSEKAARKAYLANYEKGWQGLGAITEMGIRPFRKWLKSGDHGKPVGQLPEPPKQWVPNDAKGQKPSPKPFDQTKDEYLQATYKKYLNAHPEGKLGFDDWLKSDTGRTAPMDHEIEVSNAIKNGVKVRERVAQEYKVPEMGTQAKEPWQMTYDEVRRAVTPGNRDELQASRQILAEATDKENLTVEQAEESATVPTVTPKTRAGDIATEKTPDKPEGGKPKITISANKQVRGIDGWFSMPKTEFEQGEWYVTGITKKKINEGRPLWASKEELQAEYYIHAGDGSKGIVVYSKPKAGSKILDLTNQNELEEFAEKIESMAESGNAEFSRRISEDSEHGADIRELLNPRDIVEDGAIWDDHNFMNAVWDAFGYDFIKTDNGGIYLNPGAAWILKQKPSNWEKTTTPPTSEPPKAEQKPSPESSPPPKQVGTPAEQGQVGAEEAPAERVSTETEGGGKPARKSNSEIIATDTIGGTQYEFRIGRINDPSMPQMTHQAQMRRADSDNEWEPAMTGMGISRDAALRKFAELYERHNGKIENLKIVDGKLAPFIEKETKAKQKKETELQRQEELRKESAERDAERYRKVAENENAIEETMKTAKAKKGEIKIATKPGVKIEKIQGYIIGDYGYHKIDSKSEWYAVTHIPSGYALASGRSLTQKQARELAYRHSFNSKTWDGKGKPPKDYFESAAQIRKEYLEREPFGPKLNITKLLKSEKGSSELVNDISAYGAELIRNGVDTFRAFKNSMRQKFSSMWDKIKPHVRGLWDVLNNERGMVQAWQDGGNPFNDSVVKEAVFSGQPSGRKDFSDGAERSEFPVGVGFFTDDYDVASLYAGTHPGELSGATNYSLGKRGEVGQYYLNIKNPLNLDSMKQHIWLYAAARKRMGADEYSTASNTDRIEEGWQYFLKKYGWPEDADVFDDFDMVQWRKDNDGLYGLILEKAEWAGQGYTLEYALAGKPSGMLAVLEPDIVEDIIKKFNKDGFEYTDNEHNGAKIYVPFSAEQISPITKKGMFSALNNQRGAITLTGVNTDDLRARAEFIGDEFIYQAQDRFHYLAKAQAEISGVNNAQSLPEAQDAYLAELRSHGMQGAAVDDFHEHHVTPLLDLMSEHDIKVEQAEEYLKARHAKEANRQLKKINPKKQNNDALSGMTDQEADQVLNRINGSRKARAFQEIGTHIDAITKLDRELKVKAGLETQKTIDAWEAVYQYYVPLHREGKTRMPKRGRGFASAGGQKRRAGSQKEVVNVLAHVVAQHEATISQAEKAKVGRAMYELTKNNPGPWKVDEVKYKATFDANGLVVYRPDPMQKWADHVVPVRVNGKDHTITFDEKNHSAMRIAAAMKNLSASDMGFFFSMAARLNRWLSMINTGLNPEFIISNFLRDIQTAGYNLSDSTEADAIKWKSIKEVGRAWAGIRQWQKDNRSTDWAKWFDRFRKAGAQTGWLDSYPNVVKREKALINQIEAAGPGGWRASKRAIKATFNYISDHNTAIENAIRLSVFKNLIESGATEAQAARAAKELTVNFSRRGAMGPALNSLYLFFNASIQGSARVIAAAVKSPKVRKLMIGTIAFAALNDILQRSIGGQDDDGEDRYDKIPDWVKERNLICMLPSGKGYITIPLPWGYNVFHVLGQAIGEVSTKRKNSAGASAARVVGAAIEAFNPIGNARTLTQLLSPTLARPVIQCAQNKDWAGQKLRPDNNPFFQKPSSQLYWPSVREPSKWAAKKLNELGGGNEVRPAKDFGIVPMDISPEAIDLFIDTFTGGAGRFASNIVSAPVKLLEGEPVETYEVPMLRKIYGKAGATILHKDFYERVDAVRMVERELKHYQGDPGMLKSITAEHKPEMSLMPQVKEMRKALDVYNKAIKQLQLSDNPKAKEQIRKIKDNIEKMMRNFNKAYNKATGE